MLIKSQRNQLFQELVNHGLQATDFTELSDADWYCINCKIDNALQFKIQNAASRSTGSFDILKRPGRSDSPHNLFTFNASSWNALVVLFCDWAVAVKQELELPDLWAQITKAVQLFESATEPDDEKFTIAELGALHGQLRMLGLLFKDSELLQEYQTELAKLTQLAAVKAETFTKKDWQNWIKGAFISAIASLELTEEQRQELLALVWLAFGGLFLKQ